MKTRPLYIVAISLTYILFPFISGWLSAIFEFGGFFESLQKIRQFLPGGYVVHAFFVSGVCVYVCKKWSFFLLFIANAFIVIQYSKSYISFFDFVGPFPVVILLLAGAAISAVFLEIDTRRIYFQRKLRWWDHEPRYNIGVSSQLKSKDFSVDGDLENISVNGACFQSSEAMENGLELDCVFQWKGVDYVFPSKIVHTKSGVPRFCGLQFQHSQGSKRAAKSLCRKMALGGLRIKDRNDGLLARVVSWI